MSPQEKANQLFQSFGVAIAERVDVDGFVCNTEQAKQCALIAVQEILSNPMFFSDWGTVYFWQSVKKEIEKL
jgi:hypothetical protein